MAKIVKTSGLKLRLNLEDKVVSDTYIQEKNMIQFNEDVKENNKKNDTTSFKEEESTLEDENSNENLFTDPEPNKNINQENKPNYFKVFENFIFKKKSNSIVILVCSFAIILFVVAYLISLHNASAIRKHYEFRHANMQDMIDINIGKYQDKYLINIIPFLKQQNKLKKEDNLDIEKLKKIIHDNEINRIDFVKNKFKEDPKFSINDYVEIEMSKFEDNLNAIQNNIKKKNNEILNIDNVISEIKTYFNSELKLNDKIDIRIVLKLQKQHPQKKINSEIKFIELFEIFNDDQQTINQFLSDNNLNIESDVIKKITLKEIVNNQQTPNQGLENNFISLLNNSYNNILYSEEKANLFIEIDKLNNDFNSFKKSKVSLDQYKKNKTYLFQKQFDINNETISYTIDRAISYMALYHALLIVILFFTTVMIISTLAVGVKGWKDTDPNIRLISMATIVILVMSNLILVTLRPRENYVNYIANAEKNESKQANIIKFFNNYEKLTLKQVDSTINANLESLTKFSEILPSTDDSKLAKDMSKFTDF